MTKKEFQSKYDLTKNPLDNYEKFLKIKNSLISLGIVVQDFNIDIKDFNKWRNKFYKLDNLYNSMDDVHIQKCLEHYISYKLLDFKNTDIFMDIAASGSNFANELYYNNYVKQTYLLDLAYKNGINGIKIGANAGNTKLPDEFVNKIGLHCAFECFEGTSDISTIKEISRILKPKGKFVITPLYLDETYYNCTSELCNQDLIKFDEKALKIYRDDKYKVPFSRHYSSKSFYERIYLNTPSSLKKKIVFIDNVPELMKYYKNQRIYNYFVFVGEKID